MLLCSHIKVEFEDHMDIENFDLRTNLNHSHNISTSYSRTVLSYAMDAVLVVCSASCFQVSKG